MIVMVQEVPNGITMVPDTGISSIRPRTAQEKRVLSPRRQVFSTCKCDSGLVQTQGWLGVVNATFNLYILIKGWFGW